MSMTNHKIIAEYLKDKGVITFGDLTDEAFIFDVPTNRNEPITIIFTENKQTNQRNSFNNKRLSFESRSTQIFIYSSSVAKGNIKANEIYDELYKVTKLNDTLFNMKLQSMSYLGEQNNKDQLFVIDVDYDVHKGDN